MSKTLSDDDLRPVSGGGGVMDATKNKEREDDTGGGGAGSGDGTTCTEPDLAPCGNDSGVQCP